jgi:Tol biopolymer transport system component
VTVEFSGANFDQTEPRLILDGTTTRTGIASNVTFGDLTPGNHEISLQGLHARCVRSGAASQTVAVTAGQTADVRYAVNCRDVDQLAIVVPAGSEDFGSLRVVDADGQRQHEIFTQQGGVANPAWSKDGRRLAFRYSDAPATQPGALWVVNADGTQLRKSWQVAPDAGYFIPNQIHWSPDGARLAVVAVSGGSSPNLSPSKLLLMDPDGGNLKEVTLINGGVSPAWAPDSSQLAVAFSKIHDYDAGPDDGLYIVDKAGTLGSRLTTATAVPEWSPDGSLILYSFDRLFTIHPDGTGLRELGVCPDVCGAASWSPDGTRIAVATASDIRIVDVDAQLIGAPIPTDTPGAPRWAPSSNYLAWVSNFRSLTMAEPDGTNQRDVAELPPSDNRGISPYRTPAWRP